MELTTAEQRTMQNLGGGHVWVRLAGVLAFIAGAIAIVMAFMEGAGDRGLLRYVLEQAEMGSAMTAGFWALTGLVCFVLGYNLHSRLVSYRLLAKFEARVRELERQ